MAGMALPKMSPLQFGAVPHFADGTEDVQPLPVRGSPPPGPPGVKPGTLTKGMSGPFPFGSTPAPIPATAVGRARGIWAAPAAPAPATTAAPAAPVGAPPIGGPVAAAAAAAPPSGVPAFAPAPMVARFGAGAPDSGTAVPPPRTEIGWARHLAPGEAPHNGAPAAPGAPHAPITIAQARALQGFIQTPEAQAAREGMQILESSRNNALRMAEARGGVGTPVTTAAQKAIMDDHFHQLMLLMTPAARAFQLQMEMYRQQGLPPPMPGADQGAATDGVQ